MGDGCRRAQLSAVLDDELGSRRVHGAQVAGGLIGVRQRLDADDAARDACAAGIGIVVADGQHTRAALHEHRLACDGARAGKGVGLGVVNLDGVGLDVALQLYRLLGGGIVEAHLVAADEDVVGHGRVGAVGEVTVASQLPDVADASVPDNQSGIAHTGDVQVELAVLQQQFGLLLRAYAFNLDVAQLACYGLGLTNQVFALGHLAVGSVVEHELKDGRQVLRTVLPRLGLDGQQAGVHLVGGDVATIEVEDDARAEAEQQRVGGYGAAMVGTSRAQLGVVVHLDGAEGAAVRVQLGKAVQPQGRVLQRAVEVERAGPDVGLAAVGHVGLRQVQRAVALLHQSHGAGEGSTADVACIVFVVDLCAAVENLARRALHPRRHVERHHVGLGAVGNGNLRVAGLADHHVLAVMCSADGAAVGHLGASRHRERGRGYGNALQLAQEVTLVGRLVVADALPDHCVAVLVVVPQGVDAVGGRRVGSEDADGSAALRAVAHDHLLAPVAEDVGNGSGVVLRRVGGVRAVESDETAAAGLIDSTVAGVAAR